MSHFPHPLWTIDELVEATGGELEGDVSLAGAVTGISIDTRSINRGDLFVALKDQRDGHDFVTMAFEKGAAVALVSKSYEKKADDGLLLRVDDPLIGLEKMAVAARARLGDKARVIAVTGSAGKTTTKEMLRVSFAHLGHVHASEKSYNNHWGVPLTLARMPQDTDFAVIEIGMNHAGEIRPLSKMTRPHVAVVTSVLPVHLEHFSGLEEIAEAKAEIFEGLNKEGWAVLPRDAEHFELLAHRAGEAVREPYDQIIAHVGERVQSFGEHEDAFNIVENIDLMQTGSSVGLVLGRHDGFSFEVGLPGRHNALNAVACITAFFCTIAGGEISSKGSGYEAYPGFDGVLEALKSLKMEPAGRGQVIELGNERISNLTLIDESYNANPASMRAAFENLSLYPRDRRKVAVIGDMLELGKSADDLHADLAEPIELADIDVIFACGLHMKSLFDVLPAQKQGGYAKTADDLKPVLLSALQDRDVIMVKGSNGSRLGPLVEAIKTKFSPKPGEQ